MAEGGYGGYDYEFVDKLDSKYYCLVCQNVLREPMLTDCCGIHYCQSCLQQCNRSYITQCPHCRKQNYHKMLDKQLEREIRELQIYCVNHSRKNCLWEGEVSKLSEHLSSSCPQRESVNCCEKCPNGCGKLIKSREIETHREICPLQEVTCMLNGPNINNEVVTCGQTLLRTELPSHEKICIFRTFECKFCKMASTYAAITGQMQTYKKQPRIPPEKGHYAECPDYPLYCKNKCRSGEIRRADMEQHRKECPLEMVQCERWEEGCKEMVRRKDMSGHMKAFKKQHRQYIWSAYVQKKEEAEELRKELSETKDELAATKFELNATKSDLATLRTELATKTDALATTTDALATKTDALATTTDALATKTDALATTTDQLNQARSELAAKTRELNATRSQSAFRRREMNTNTEQPQPRSSKKCCIS